MQTFQLAAPPGDRLWVGHSGMRFTPDGRYLCVPANARNVLDTLGDRPPQEFRFHVYGFAGGVPLCVGCDSPTTGSLVLTDLRTGERSGRELEGCMISDGAVGADGDRLYLALYLPFRPNEGRESEVRVLSADSLRERFAFGRRQKPIYRVAVPTSGGRLAVYGSDGLEVWDVAAERPPTEPLVRLPLKRWNPDFALSADGSRLAAVDTSGLTVWDAATGAEAFRSGKHRRGVTAVACHPARPLLVTGDNGGQVFLWDFTGRVLTRFDWKLGEVRVLCFSPDGLRCAAVGAGGQVVVWDVDA